MNRVCILKLCIRHDHISHVDHRPHNVRRLLRMDPRICTPNDSGVPRNFLHGSSCPSSMIRLSFSVLQFGLGFRVGRCDFGKQRSLLDFSFDPFVIDSRSVGCSKFIFDCSLKHVETKLVHRPTIVLVPTKTNKKN